MSLTQQLLRAQANKRDPNAVVQIECGVFHSLVVTHDGKVYGFGDNSQGQIESISNMLTKNEYVIRKPKRLTAMKHFAD